MGRRGERHERILELIRRNRIDSQDQLLDLLAVEGFPTTQSTISRDLRELGVVKAPEGYRAPEDGTAGRGGLERLAAELADRIEEADAGGAIVVLRPTRASDAGPLADRIDRAGLPQVVAATASGKRVLVIARSQAYARELVIVFRRRPADRPGGEKRRFRFFS